MRKTSYILIIFVLVALFAGCRGSTSAPSDSDSTAPEITPTLKLEDRQDYTEDGKAIIYIGAFSSGNYEITEAYSRLENAVNLFNAKSKTYKSEIIDYGDLSAREALYRLNAEIIAGKMPDMLLTFGMPAEKYASLGFLYDMNDWFDPSEYFTGPLNSMRTDGKLYEVSPGITVTGFYGLSSNLGSSGELSLDELYTVWERFNADGTKAFVSGMPNELICLLLISSSESQFVDINTYTCSFNSPDFIKLLEFCKKLPDNPVALDLDSNSSDLQGSSLGASFKPLPDTHYPLSVKKGEALLGMLSSSRTWGFPYGPHALMTYILDNTDVTFVGIPGSKSSMVYMEFPLAVSASSKNLDGAREFIDGLWSISFMNRAPGDFVMLPLKRSTLDKFVQANKDKYAFNGKEAIFDVSAGLDEPYSLADFEGFLKFVDEAQLPVRTPIALYIPPYSITNISRAAQKQAPQPSSFVNPIIAEEIQAFFAGTQNAKRTAELIQSRYSIYLEEQRK
jgi:ABC-type glycerol-3-phosphate transport system substrate-binding protein